MLIKLQVSQSGKKTKWETKFNNGKEQTTNRTASMYKQIILMDQDSFCSFHNF